MGNKKASIIFPDKQKQNTTVIHFSKDEIRSLCNLQPVTDCAKSMGNYFVQKNKTKQLKAQYATMESAVDAEYSELENQAYIYFQELTNQLEIEFQSKKKALEIQMQKAEIEADKAFHENQVAFEKYLLCSTEYRNIFNNLSESAERICKLIQFAEKEDIAVNTKYYIKLCEQYRRLLRGIEKYNSLV